ncbi:DUF2092 domain-containing protein [uncultured Shimia sp.]|uniref:DUF2092 domain-containing protein n=1 Tax=uncultured Shimia sp. TaxID=573152 RepID=UPI0026221E18|nr:DUF2092 domain-containing protein [uncultured Shimia sp.]
MHVLKYALIVGTMSFAGMSAAQSDAPPPAMDPQAVEILTSAAKYLSEQNTLSVKWFVSNDTVLEGREKLTQIRSGYSLLDREGGYYGYLERGLAAREFYFDGASLSVNDVENDAYAQIAFAGDFEGLVDRAKEEYNLDLPIWSVLSMQYGEGYLDAAEKAAYVGLTRIGGEVAHHIALSNYDEDWQVWIADDPESPRLIMLVGTDPYTQGWPQYRAYFTDWNFSPEIAEGAFTYVPGEDSEQMIWPRVPGN